VPNSLDSGRVFRLRKSLQGSYARPLSREFGTPKTVKARFWPWLEPFFKKYLTLFPFRSAVGWTGVSSLGFAERRGPTRLNATAVHNRIVFVY